MSTSQEPVEAEEKASQVPLTRLPRLFVSRRWWWVSILVVAGMAVTFRLGIWQVNRLQQRRARNAEYIEQIQAAPLALDGDGLTASADELRDRLAESEGRFDFDEQVVLVQQNYEGRPGVHLIAPFVIDGTNEAILVDRGWIPAHEYERGELGRFADLGQDTVHGSLQPSQTLSGGRVSDVDGRQDEWYRIDIEAIQEQLPYELLSAYLMEAPPAEIQEHLPYRVEPEIDLSEGPHLGYAIQWFLFCLMLAVGYAYFVRTRS
jgi:surfeit locus 1 family protein